MQTIKLRQITENQGGPLASKSDAKGVSWASKSYAKTVLTKLQYVTSWEWDWVAYLDAAIEFQTLCHFVVLVTVMNIGTWMG